MISVTAEFNTQITKDSRTFRARLLKAESPISGEVKTVTINKGACGEDLFSIGSVYSSYIEVVMDECEEKLENEELLLQIGLVIGDSVEYVNVGYYTVTKPKNTAYQTTFTAVGRITAKMNCLPNNMPATPTLANLASAITETTGVAIICKGVTLAGTIEEDLTGYTCREILEVIVSVLGGFATEDSAGNIVISKFSAENPIAYNGDRTVTLPEFNDYDYVLSGVKVIKTEEWTDEDDTVHAEISYTEGTPRQTLSNKFMTAGLFSAFTDNVIGFSYRPGNIPLALGDPRLEPWDCIAFTDVNGNVYTVPCMNIVHTFDGGLSTMITAPGESETESETQTKGPIIQQLERMATQLFTAEQAILKRLTVDQADIKYANIQTLNAAVGRIDSLSGELASFKTGEFETLKAGVAEIEKAYIKAADVETIIAGKGYITDLQTKTLLSDYAKITTLESDYVKTNQLEAKVGTFGYLKTTSLESEVGKFGYLKTDSLESEVGKFGYLKTSELEANVGNFGFLKADSADLTSLLADKVDVNLANINTAWVEDLMVKGNFVTDNVNAATGSFSKYLTGVKIIGDLIEANTLKAKVLIIEGEDGIFRRLNINALGEAVVNSDPKYNEGLDGSIIVAKSITADQINVTDLFAQTITATGTISGATLKSTHIETLSGSIGGFNIGSSYIASANTTALGTTANSVYLGLDGISLGTAFKVTAAGKMTATGAEITGTLNRTKITDNGMEIMDASGNTVARYGTNVIDLGVASADAVINLCGGLGNIKGATHDSGALSALGINANILKLNATGTTGYLSLNVAKTNGYSGSFVLYGAGSDAYADLTLKDGTTYKFRADKLTAPGEIWASYIHSDTDVQMVGDLWVGGDIYGYKFQGPTGGRPTYNGDRIALMSDVDNAAAGVDLTGYIKNRGLLGSAVTNANATNIAVGIYTLNNSNVSNLPATGLYGAFFQYPGDHKPQMVIGGTDGVGAIYVRRYLTGSSAWTAWAQMVTTADLSKYALAGHSHSEYALSGHTHSNYAAAGHVHADYALRIHEHTEYAKSDNLDKLSEEIVNLAVTPQMYGAVGDGVTDDTQALKTALANNSAVFLPKGTYLIKEPIDLTQGKSLYSYNQEGVIKYTGSGSVILLGRRSRISGVKILVQSATVSHVFNTDNRRFSSSVATLMTEVHDIEVYFADVYNVTLINIVASNKDYLGVSGFHNQSYSNIRVAGESKIKYGIKICVSFDAAYKAGVTGALPWITDMRFNHIWLGCPETAIKIHRENNSGTEIDYASIVRTEHMMFTDVAAQYANSTHTKKFYDVEWCMAEFINCQSWDYHPIINGGGKYNTIGAGALLSEVNARRSPIDVAEFPSVTNKTPKTDPAYFLNTFFNFASNIDGKYDYIDMKCEKKISEIEIDEVQIENIAQNVVNESMTGIYKNVMTDPLTTVYVEKRYSASSSSWVASGYDTLIIPVRLGTNLIRWQGNDLSDGYKGVYLSNDLVSCVVVEEHDKITVTTESGDTYLEIDNSGGYKYATIPFLHKEPTMNANNMIVTINELIKEGPLTSISEHLNDVDIHVTPEDKQRWDNNAGIGTTSETWTFTLSDGSTVTKKVVLA